MQRTPTCKNCCKSYGFKDVTKPIGNRIPLLLECGHTFCEGCVTKWARLQKTEVSCSDCHHPTPLAIEGEKGVMAIPPNIFLLGVMTNSKRASYRTDVQKPGRSKLGTKAGLQRAINQFTREKKAELMKIDTGVQCEECTRATATSSCSKCETVYCRACFERVHSYSVALRKHVPLPVAKKNTETAVGCPDHNNRPLEFYDKDDCQPVCSHCVVTGERQTHAIAPIDEIAKEVEDQFKTSVDEVAPVIKCLDKSVQVICKALPGVKAEKNEIVNDIREHFQMLYSALQTREQSLIKEVELNHNGEKILEKMREEVADNLRKAKDYVHEVESMIGQPQTLIDNAKKLRRELECVKEMQCCAVKVISHEDQIRFETRGEMRETITEYGSVSTDGCARFEMKKLSEMNEEYLGVESDDSEQELVNAQEEQEDTADNQLSDQRMQHQRTPGSITVSRILKSNLAYRHELVLVTHIRDPCQFMIQRVADLEQLQIMMNVINIYCDSTENVHDLLYDVKFGDMCCAQFTTDNQWYRARIKMAYSPAHPNTVPTLENNLCVEVQYIDYGNSEWLPLSRLRKMKAEFLNVPELRECCCLADIVPPFQEEKWPAKAIKAFGSLTGDKPLLMTVIGRKGNKLVVDLRRPEDDEPTQDDDRPVSVRDALVFLEVARFSSPASKPEGLFFPKKTYKEAVHIGEGAFVDVLVTHVAAPDEIYVQKLRSEETTELQHIMEEMSKMFGGRRRGTEWSVPWPYKGLVCAARFTEDKIWYRALVTAVNSDETVDVTYVDFGNSEKLTFSEIRKLPDMFLRLPKQALPVCLVDIKPNEEEWQGQDQQNVSSLLLNRSLVFEVKGVVDNKMSVLLYDTTGAQDVCINQFLVQHGYCQTAGLGHLKQKEAEKTEYLETGKMRRRNSLCRILACSFKRSCSIVKTRDELATESENARDNTENEIQPEQNVEETETGKETANEPDIQTEKESQASSFREEERAVSEDRTEPQASETSSASFDYKELKYKAATIPEGKKFQAGVTFVDSQGYVYAQEVKEGDRTLINIMGTLLERYGKSEDQSGAPSDVTSLFPGLPCVAQFAEDGMWYRASVIKILEEDKVEVSYVDFGNSEVVSLSAIRQEMPFMEVPNQCLQLVLRGIEPKTSDGHWPPEAILALSQAVVGQDCMATIRGDKLPGYPLVVNLSLPDGSDVAQSLLSRGLVQRSPAPGDEEQSSQFHPRKPGPRKAKPFISKRSVTETRAHAQMISSREAECVLVQSELPGDGIRFDVTITHIERPDCLFIQRVPPTEIDKGYADDLDPTLDVATEELRMLEEIMAKINSPDYFKKYTPLATAKEGMLCCARYTEDDMWYRAQIQSVEHQRPLEVKALYVDYGTTEVLKADRLRGFPSELLDLPVQATRCFLADIRPPDKTDGPMMDDTCWPVSSMETLIQLVAGKKLVAKVLFNGPPASVMLYEHTERHDGCVEEVSIGFLLAQRGLAKCVDYEVPVYAESDTHTDESYESEERTLEFQESELKFTSKDRLEISTETKADSSSTKLLEKIPTPARNLPPAKQLLKPAELTSKVTDTVSRNCESEVKKTEPSLDGVESSQQTTEGVQSRDEKETASPPLTSAPVAKVTSTNKNTNSAEVNKDSLESAV